MHCIPTLSFLLAAIFSRVYHCAGVATLDVAARAGGMQSTDSLRRGVSVLLMLILLDMAPYVIYNYIGIIFICEMHTRKDVIYIFII